jgi:carbon starvation protein
MLTSLLIVVGWSYFIWTGNIRTIWPMFGIANQLLASVALAVATTILINLGRARYAWVTLMPLAFVSVTTLTAGFLSVKNQFWPMAVGAQPDLRFQGAMNSGLTVIMMVAVVIVLGAALRKWTGSSAEAGRGLEPQPEG